MKKKSIITFCCLFVFITFAAVYYTRPGCDAIGGRWASAKSTCYSKLCYHLGDCGGPWVSTAIPCPDVKKGETEAMLNFYFGNPDSKKENRIFWSTGKPNPVTIEAILDNGKLAELRCPE